MNDSLAIGLAASALVLVATAAGYFAYQESKQWQQFSTSHNCVKVGEVSGSMTTGYGLETNGQMGMVTTYQAGKTGFKCDDGVTYWR